MPTIEGKVQGSRGDLAPLFSGAAVTADPGLSESRGQGLNLAGMEKILGHHDLQAPRINGLPDDRADLEQGFFQIF
jgi:hypothetical protein